MTRINPGIVDRKGRGSGFVTRGSENRKKFDYSKKIRIGR